MSIYIISIILLITDRLIAFLNTVIFKINYVPLIINAGLNKTHRKFVSYYIIIMIILMMILVLISIFVNSPTDKVFDPYPYWFFIFLIGFIWQQIFFEMKFIKESKQFNFTLTRGFINFVVLLFFL